MAHISFLGKSVTLKSIEHVVIDQLEIYTDMEPSNEQQAKYNNEFIPVPGGSYEIVAILGKNFGKIVDAEGNTPFAGMDFYMLENNTELIIVGCKESDINNVFELI